MKALKAVVVILGILIIISFVLLIYGFYARMTDPDFAIMRSGEEAIEAAPRVSTIAVPAGCIMAEMSPAGDRLFIRLSGTDEACNRIVVVDVESGREIAIFTIAP
jgi:hypothetical protein